MHPETGPPRPGFAKHSNEVRLIEDSAGKPWVWKDLRRATARFGSWPLEHNELLASRLAQSLGVHVPRARPGPRPHTLLSRFHGIDLYQLHATGGPPPELFRPAHRLQDLADILVFSHWIGDSDRTIHHLVVDSDESLWSIDYEFCGFKPPGNAYPEEEADVGEVEHITCRDAFCDPRPVSPRLLARFPALRGWRDAYPWNASVVYFLMREHRLRISTGGRLEAAVGKIGRAVPATVRSICGEVFGETELAARMSRYLLERRRRLPRVIERWKEYLAQQEEKCGR